MLVFRLPYPYGKPQVYFPTDLYLTAARLMTAGIDAKVHDLNRQGMPDRAELDQYDCFGIGVFGAPYIPGSIKLAQALAKEGKPILVGGQAIAKLPPEHFARIYQKDQNGTVQVNTDADLEKTLEVRAPLPPLERTSFVPAVSGMDDKTFKMYLEREFSFCVSQGCRYACTFCAAEKKRPETFRELDVMRADLEYLAENARRSSISSLKMYLSSLDLFQNPLQFGRVLAMFADVRKNYKVDFILRGLSRVDSFTNALDECPELEDLIAEAGLQTIGFGVDGSSEKIWRSQKKGIKDLSQPDRALEKCREIGVTPEILMVMGFQQDTLGTMLKTYGYALSRLVTHNAVSRPYLAKPFVPGNDGWGDPQYEGSINTLVENPELFLNLDFAALGSTLTHPRTLHRLTSNFMYLLLITTAELVGKNATYPLLPLGKDCLWNGLVRKINKWIPFDK